MLTQNFEFTDHLHLPAQESFKLLNTNLGIHEKGEKLKMISITSFDEGEGKTSVAINLAIAAAKSGTRVLLIDADLRKPGKLKSYLDECTSGLTDLCDGREYEDIICRTNIHNMEYITAGISNVEPGEFLNSRIFDGLLEYASRLYELVFIDTPCMGSYADCAIIASKVSGVLIVARFQKTSYKNIERIKWQMKNVGANIIGVVVNRVSRQDYKSYFILRKRSKV